jgi:D-arabinose 1-dehydrogenase-like Zn-dependent alcohol dehydrogenase
LRPDLIVDHNDPQATGKLAEMTNGIGCDAAIVCTDHVPAADWALKIVRPRGTVMLLGLPDDGYKFDSFSLVFREIVVKGSLHSIRDEVEAMMKVVDEHKILSHLTELSIDSAEALPERVSRHDFEGRLVVII